MDMDDETPDPGSGQDLHLYPRDLAHLVYRRWAEAGTRVCPAVPDVAALEHVLSVCYQATLLREEGRPVTFRLALSDPDTFEPASGPPTGLHRLVFTRPLPLDQHELRRVAPAAEFSRSLLGATLSGGTAPEIWGIIHSGPQWLQSVRGGRETAQTIPPVLMVAATGPGRLLVSVGAVTLAELRNGTLSGREMDVFQAPWLQNMLGEVGRIEWAAHIQDREHAGEHGTNVSSAFGSVLAGHVLRRVLTTIRAGQHGGTLILVPRRRAVDLLSDGRFVHVKYEMVDEEPRDRISTLAVNIMNELARTKEPDLPAGWSAYEASRAQEIGELDEALFEVAHLVADLSRVDGAVLMTDCLEIVGFGVEIAGDLPEVPRVARAKDLEGVERDWVRTDRVGTRHRSAYRLCQAVHDALAVVVSQDGGLRFVRWHNDGVTYWEQIATGPGEV